MPVLAQTSKIDFNMSAFRSEDQKKEKKYNINLESKINVKKKYSMIIDYDIDYSSELGFMATTYDDDRFVWTPTKNHFKLTIDLRGKDMFLSPCLSNTLESSLIRNVTYARGAFEAKAAFMDPYTLTNSIGMVWQHKSKDLFCKIQPGICYVQIYSKDFNSTTDDRLTKSIETSFCKYSWEIKTESQIAIDSSLSYRDKMSYQQTFDKKFRKMLKYSGTIAYTLYKSITISLDLAVTYDSFVSETMGFSQLFGIGISTTL